MSNNLITQSIKKSLEQVVVNERKQNLIDAGLLSNILIRDNEIDIIIEFSQGLPIDQKNIQTQIENVLKQSYSQNIRVIFSSKREERPIKQKQKIPNVKKIILMASAKGGVGKSTTSVNIAIALAKQDFSVGIVDADIYGPTIPKLLGINQKPDVADGKMLPIEKNNIHSISIGYIVDEAQAAIWRGPMVSKALYQLLLGVKWPNLDYLIIDMPPGTGDIYLSLAENFVIDGVVLISTPQNIALTMVKKSISFFNKTNIPIIGIIENMSYFLDIENNIKHNIFGEQVTEEFAKKMGSKLLGNIPLIPKISEFSDKGKNLLEESEFEVYSKIAQNIIS